METNMTLTVGFKGAININGAPIFNHDGAPLTVGGIIDDTNTETAYFGCVVSANIANPHQFLLGIDTGYTPVGVLQNDYSVNENQPAKPNYILNAFPATVIVFGACWIQSWTHAGAGTLTTPYRGCAVIFNDTTGAIEFLPPATAIPAGYTLLNASVKEVNMDVNKVMLFVGVSDAETQTPPLSSAKAIEFFGFPSLDQFCNIVESTGAITVTVPNGTVVTALVANFIATGDSIAIGATPQVSGVTANDFTSPVVYVVTAEDGTTKNYTVTVTVAP